MVYLNRKSHISKRNILFLQLPRKYLRSTFIDTLHLHVRGGTGGAGLPHYGGIGGAGGNVYVIAKDGLTLENVVKTLKSKRIKADLGSDSKAKGIIGAPGQDKVISVPRGIMIYNQNGVLLGKHNFSSIMFVLYTLIAYFFIFFII